MSNHPAPPRKEEETVAIKPLIPEAYLSITSQKFLFTSIGVLVQAFKAMDFINSREDGTLSGGKWLLSDFALLATLAQLRIPGLDYKFSTVVLQILILWALNAILFWWVDDGPLSTILSLESIPEFSVASLLPFISGMFQKHTPRRGNLLARINPDSHSFCIQSPEDGVYIPVLVSNFKATGLRYSFTPFGYATDSRYSSSSESLDLNRKDLNTIQRQRVKYLKSLQASSSVYGLDEKIGFTRQLQPSESLLYIKLTKPGTIKLQRAYDSKKDGRIITPAEIQVAPCPRAEFSDVGSIGDYRCAGEDPDARLFANVFGVPPLHLRWSKILNGKTEYSIDEISHGLAQDRRGGSRYSGDGYDERGNNLRVPQELQFPLLISLDIPGDHQYVLEDITDSLGNLVMLGSGFTTTDVHAIATKTSRSFQVLRRPSIAFKDCSVENPTSILIGSDTQLGISGNITDSFDPGWEVVVKYQPPGGDYKGMRRLLPWEKTFSTEGSRRSVDVRASAPGEYTILEAKGKRCPADVMEPNICQVVERPYPTAEMTVNRLNDCTGDTGMSALVSLQGTPPFELWYRIQRNEEPFHERSTLFKTDHQGEVLLEPAQPGRYVYTFYQLSDANYKKIELPGPKIEQVSSIPREIPRGISNSDFCPDGQRILPFFELESEKQILEIPIPEFRGNMEEASMLISAGVLFATSGDALIVLPWFIVTTPGVTINVRSTKPMVGFAGENDQFNVTILEQERAKLALNLTGSSPWRIKYRRTEAKNMNLTIAVSTNSMFIPTTDKGNYELLEVSDSFCSGTVMADSSSFRIDWVPRPSVKLSPQTFSHYVPHNGSHILQPVCEGMDDYADLNIFGQVFYEVDQIGDSSYPIKEKDDRIMSANRLLFDNVNSYATIDHLNAETTNHVWKPQLPSYMFRDAGLHSLTIETLIDGSNCLHSEIHPSWKSILINVEPTAAIIPLDHRGHYCVGETAHFHLEGSAPWMINYRINSNGYTHEAKSPSLSIPLDRAGELAILSVAHRNQARKVTLHNSRYTIYRLPSATVAHGQTVHEDIHDGDQAKIVFTLIGVPPFTFTYQRSEFNPKQKGKAGKVLETHTSLM
ncbi:hypothetical protein BD779DRAFT_1471742 [Infundibulicybe gibba]|nr:hypothetical protein BD779DRAFT_1471742 [Infundibulicybe gibba]